MSRLFMEKQIEKLRRVAGAKPILAWRSAYWCLQPAPLPQAQCSLLPLQRWWHRGAETVPATPDRTSLAAAGSCRNAALCLLCSSLLDTGTAGTASRILLPKGDGQAEAGACLPSG